VELLLCRSDKSDVQQGSLEIAEAEKLGLRLTMDDGMERYGRASGI